MLGVDSTPDEEEAGRPSNWTRSAFRRTPSTIHHSRRVHSTEASYSKDEMLKRAGEWWTKKWSYDDQQCYNFVDSAMNTTYSEKWYQTSTKMLGFVRKMQPWP